MTHDFQKIQIYNKDLLTASLFFYKLNYGSNSCIIICTVLLKRSINPSVDAYLFKKRNYSIKNIIFVITYATKVIN